MTIRDCCPQNFVDAPLDDLPHNDLLHLDTLNTMLAVLNASFCSRAGIESGTRLPISLLIEEMDV